MVPFRPSLSFYSPFGWSVCCGPGFLVTFKPSLRIMQIPYFPLKLAFADVVLFCILLGLALCFERAPKSVVQFVLTSVDCHIRFLVLLMVSNFCMAKGCRAPSHTLHGSHPSPPQAACYVYHMLYQGWGWGVPCLQSPYGSLLLCQIAGSLVYHIYTPQCTTQGPWVSLQPCACAVSQ